MKKIKEGEEDNFLKLGISKELDKSIKQLGYETPTPIQKKSIPPLIGGKNIIGQAQTGTGKTAAFALPILTRINIQKSIPQALILTPTRELAIQVAEAFQAYARHLKGFHVLPIYGGADIRIQLRGLKRGAHIIVGTPGRMLDHLNRKSLSLGNIKTLVLDEADEMLRMGFIEDVETILSKIPESRQIVLFSATMPARIQQVAKNHVQDPAIIKIKSKTETVEAITQEFIIIRQNEKIGYLTDYLESEDFDGVIIFVRTREATLTVAEKLNARGYVTAAINGDISQSIREKTISRLKKSKIDILVATDVAARGIDVERISHIVNFDIPYDSESYVHRIGRTGRAGRKGKALLFVQPREKHLLNIIEKTNKKKIRLWKKPSEKELVEKKILGLKKNLGKLLESPTPQIYDQLINDLCGSLNRSAKDIAIALLYDKFSPESLKTSVEKIEKKKPRNNYSKPRKKKIKSKKNKLKSKKIAKSKKNF